MNNMEQLLLHLLGDYIIQNDWMALNKKKYTWMGELACQLHCITYTLPFLLLTTNPLALFLIYGTHYILDRTNIVSHFLALRNGVKDTRNFGFGAHRPIFITAWLNIITDNVFHLLFNYLVLRYVA